MIDLDKRVEWLRARVPIEDVYLDHVRFIMKHYAEEYHQHKLNNDGVLGDVIASDPDSSSELFEQGNYRCKCGLMKIDCDKWVDCKVKTSIKSK